MLQVKSVVTLKANPGIFKRIGGIKTWMYLYVERGSYLGFGNRVGMTKIEKKLMK